MIYCIMVCVFLAAVLSYYIFLELCVHILHLVLVTFLTAETKYLAGDNLWKKSFLGAYDFRKYGPLCHTP